MALHDQHTGTRRSPEREIRQLVLFVVEGRTFAVDVSFVREIRSWQPVTEVPNPRPFLLGVINLRGSVIPIVDLHARLGIDRHHRGEDGVVIVVERDGQSAGFLADSVSDIVTATAEQFHDPIETGASDDKILKAILMIEHQIIGVLDLAALIPAVEPALAA